MNNNRLLQVVGVVVVLMAVAASGVAAAPAPTGPEGNVAYSQCQAILRQELGTVMPSGWSGYQENNCSTGDQAAPASVTGRGPYASPQAAGLSTLDNPHNQWIGPETVSAAQGQVAAVSPLDNPNGQWIGPETVSAALGQVAAVSPLDNPNGRWIGPETVSAALGQQSDSFPTTGGSGDLTLGAASWKDAGASGRGPYASPQAAPVSTRRQNSDAPGR